MSWLKYNIIAFKGFIILKRITLFALPLIGYLFGENVSFGQDTFSIVAVDSSTSEVGSAGASCVDTRTVPEGSILLSDIHPGVGGINTQALWNQENQNYAKRLMDQNFSPQEELEIP